MAKPFNNSLFGKIALYFSSWLLLVDILLPLLLFKMGISLSAFYPYYSLILKLSILICCCLSYYGQHVNFVSKELTLQKMFISSFLFVLTIPLLLSANILTSLVSYNAALRATSVFSDISVPVIFVIGIIVPLLEEIFFRGLLFAMLKENCSFFASVFISSLFFSIVHIDINQITYGFIFSAFAILINETVGCIAPSVIFHIFINTFTLITVKNGSSCLLHSEKKAALVLFIMTFVCSILLLVILKKMLKSKVIISEKHLFVANNIMTPSMVFSVVFYSFLMIIILLR